MKRFSTFCIMLAVMALALPAFAQPVSLTVNGVPSGASISQGDMLTWQITLPVGAISNNELWVDVNANGRAEAGTDRAIFVFTQQDGQSGNDGPGDGDFMVNGVINTQFPAGLAPTMWVFVAVSGPSSDTASFTVTPLSSPTAQITGSISAPGGFDKSYILVEASQYNEGGGGGMDIFWHGLTDAMGNYTINMGGAPASMNPWRVRLAEQMSLGRMIPFPGDTVVNVGGSVVVNFQLIQGTVLTGIVYNQLEQPLEGAYPHLHDTLNTMGYNQNQFGGNTGPDGRFAFAAPPGSYFLHFTADGYFDQWYNGQSNSGLANVITITTEDTIWNLDGMLIKGAELKGQVRNYGQPTSASVHVRNMENTWSWDGGTNDDGSWSVTVNPGTYYVSFEKDGTTQYYDHQDFGPGNQIMVSGTETISNIDADFEKGVPPPPPAPQVLNIWDVPFDNGRHVYVKWRGSESGTPIASDGPPLGTESYSLWRWDAGTGWVYMNSVPATHDSTYTAIVQTLRDSTITGGMYWSKYRVKSHYSYNFYVLSSVPDSGYSLDNMAPGVPGGVGSVVNGPDVTVRWNFNEEEDFQYYAVYRSTTPDFSVSGLVPLSLTAGTEFTDLGGASATYYYKITAVDQAGNESAPSLPVSSSGTTAVDGPVVVPTTYALRQNFPNPFNPSTEIVFDLPEEGVARITVYNALGQHVADLFDGQLSAGRHSVTFDASGLPTGLYVYRLQSGKFSAMKKMNLVK